MGSGDEVRIEHDTLGPVEVPADARWGAQTQRAVENFPISGRRLDRRLIAAIAMVKREAALANASLDEVAAVDDRVAGAIVAAADAVIAGEWDAEFPIDVYQTGSGTSSNMNVNEVLASLATESLGAPVHPNDQVNASQSSNDVVPTAIRLAAARAVADELLPALEVLQASLEERGKAFADVVKSGRTHLMDAVPVTLGQELGGHAHQVAEARQRIESGMARLGSLPIGGTAAGTGLNCPAGFATKVVAGLAEATGLELSEAGDHFALQGAMDSLVELSGHLRTLAVAMTKIANDVRWMGSGPRTGLSELRLPDLQPGSSIMPGKVNPVLPEVVTQVAARVMGNDATVGFAGSQGAFELNTYLPVMGDALIESIVLLSNASRVFAERCIDGLEADEERCRSYAEATPAVATALNPAIGYERAAAIVKESMRTGRPVRELVLEAGLLGEAELDEALDLRALADPHGRD